MICKTCHKDKLETDFYASKINKLGRDLHCKFCRTSFARTTKGIFYRYKHSAAQKGLEFSLTLEDMPYFKSTSCEYCGQGMKRIGIDRVDNKKGYVIENCVPCCTICNRMKRDLPLSKFKAHVGRLNYNMNKSNKLLRVA